MKTMTGENRPLVMNEMDEVQDSKKSIRSFKTFKIYRIFFILIKKIRTMITCNRLDLETIGFWPILFKNIPEHCMQMVVWSVKVGVEMYNWKEVKNIGYLITYIEAITHAFLAVSII